MNSMILRGSSSGKFAHSRQVSTTVKRASRAGLSGAAWRSLRVVMARSRLHQRLQVVLLEQNRDLVICEVSQLPIGNVDRGRLGDILDRHSDQILGSRRRRKRLLRHVEVANRLRYLEQVALVLGAKPVH